jgi:hypothetical protein
MVILPAPMNIGETPAICWWVQDLFVNAIW